MADAIATYPTIPPLVEKQPRPFWSVMITAYDRCEYLEFALASVLKQALPPNQMQIEVLNDGAAKSIQDRLRAIVRRVAGDRVLFYCHPVNLGGGPEFANLCIERAQGEWVHILHDDDLVRPGFYAELRKGIEQAPEAGMAFCRHIFMTGQQGRLSRLERETPGIIDDWVEQIGGDCRIQYGSIVVKRKAYEFAGGFCPDVRGASDWEMWQRLAVHFPTWYEPQTLAVYRQHDNSITGTLGRNGAHCAALRRVIETMNGYFKRHLSEEFADRVSGKARRYYGEYALSFAHRFLNERDYEAAVFNLREAMVCDPSQQMRQRATRVLLSIRDQPAAHFEGSIHGISLRGDSNHMRHWASVMRGEWQPHIYRLLSTQLQSDSVYCEIGSGIGSTLIFAAQKCANAYCFEPDPTSYRHLLWNISLNKLQNVVPFHLAVGETNGIRPLPAGPTLESSDLTHQGYNGSPLPWISWSGWQTLVQPDPIDFMYIDVGGAEAELLRGMREYLMQHKPMLLINTYAPNLSAAGRGAAMRQVADVLAIYRNCYDEQLRPADLSDLTSDIGTEQSHRLVLTE